MFNGAKYGYLALNAIKNSLSIELSLITKHKSSNTKE